MTTTLPGTRPPELPSRPNALWRAWFGVALIPIGLITAFAVGEALYAAFGHDAGTGPWWVELVVTVGVLAVCLAPCVLATASGRQAGRPGRIPAGIGFLAGLALVVLTLITEIGDLVRR